MGADKSILAIAQAQNAQIFVGRLCQTPTPGRFTETAYKSSRSLAVFGAGDEARTRDVHLGKVVLYQLSYTRIFKRGVIMSRRLSDATFNCFRESENR